MKATLLLLALAGLLAVALGLQQVKIEPKPDRVFTTSDELQARDDLPGGRMVQANTAYRRCENGQGQRASQGEWIYYARDGGRYTFREGCWR